MQTFRSFEEASLALVQQDGPQDEAALPARSAALWDLSAALSAPLDYRGVRKFRSIEEADQDRPYRAAFIVERPAHRENHGRGSRGRSPREPRGVVRL